MTTDGSGDTIPLSVVVVTYNEADRVRDCLDSVFRACRDVDRFEVVLVDSNSTDGTVERAADYPVGVYRIPDDDLCTPAAGRYVGTAVTTGESVLFVDGDMELADGWLARAREELRREGVAAVDGSLNEPPERDAVRRVDSVRGVALYDRAALESVGGFDPYLRSLEDIQLGYELTARGHRLHRLPLVAASHPTGDALLEPLRRWRNGYSHGLGQAMRRSASSPGLVRKHVYRIRHRLVVGAWLCLGLVVAGTDRVPVVGWLVLSLAGFAALSLRLGVRAAVGFLANKLFGLVGLGLGALERPRPPESFPLERVERVQAGRVHERPATVPDA